MILEILPSPIVVFNIGINFIEFALEFIIFLFFLSDARRERTEKGVHGGLSIRFGLSYLFFAMARLFFIFWDYVNFSQLFRAIAWIFNALAISFIVYVFYRVFDKYLPKLKLYITLGTPIGITLFIVYAFYVFVFQNNIIILFIFTAFLFLMFFPPIYAFTKIIFERESEVRKYIFAVMFGLFFLILGQIIPPIADMINSSISPLDRFIKNDFKLFIKITGHCILILGITLFALGFWDIPTLKEFEWREKMRHLFLIMAGGVNVYDHPFIIEKALESDLIAGGISGISSLIQELTKSKERVEVIKQKDLKILLKYGTYITAALISEDDLEILHSKLKSLVLEFENLFQYVLPEWKGDLDVFSPVKVMVERIFK